MKAVISSTLDDFYLFFLPITIWSWNKIGVRTICFLPEFDKENNQKISAKLNLAFAYADYDFIFRTFQAPPDKVATYAQCARLYAAAMNGLDANEILITSDVDMAVFGDYFNQANLEAVQIFGADLVPENQYPMCYVSAPVHMWAEFMDIDPQLTYQDYLDMLLGPIECDHFRGNQWAKDQDTLFKQIQASNLPVIKHNRAIFPHKFATRRADRDGWPEVLPDGIVDAHLPRPGYTEENFNKILTLFRQAYPDENFDWLINYRNEYIKYAPNSRTSGNA